MCREANRKDMLDAAIEDVELDDAVHLMDEPDEIDDIILDEVLITRCKKCHGLGYMLAFKNEPCPACGGKG